MNLGLKFIYSLNVLLAVFSIFAYLSPFVDPHITGFFGFFGLGFPILLICHIIFLVFWLVVKPKKSILSIIILALGYGHCTKAIGFNKPQKEEAGIEIMSYNIGYTRRLLHGKTSKSKKNAFIKFIKDENPDIICLQERAHYQFDIYEDIFDGYTLHPDKKIGTAIYTKLPIVNKGNITFDTKAHNATWIDVKYKKQILRVYSVHLSSNKVRKFSDNLKEMWDESMHILDKYNTHAKIRVNQIKEILAHAKTSKYPVVITGDFNDIPQSYIYNMMTKEYCDAFVERGSGLGKTFKTIIPGLRIDFAFVSNKLNVLEHEILKTDLSDHYPILTKVNFNN
ncbi:MAG: endonuclease/exonuclease/phosphatase family protein [Bacteroidia bacterium]|nr:endonuclease/exonuclease/phosphatase family protein [Bacteroidia bacterium]